MRRFRRRLIILLVIVAAAVLAAQHYAAPTARRLLLKEIKRTTGLTPSVGAVRLAVWRGAATAHDVVLANLHPFREPTLLRARAVTVNVALLPLLSKRIVVQKVTLRGAELTVERNRQGRTNLQVLMERLGGGRGPSVRAPVRVNKIALADSTIRYIDHAAGSPPARLVVEDVQALITNIDPSNTDDPLATSFRAQGAIATPRRGRLLAEGRTNPFHRSVNFDLKLTIEGLDLPALQRLYPPSPVVFRDGLAFLTTSATCRNYRLNAHNRLVLYNLDLRPRGPSPVVAGLPLTTVVAFLEREDRIDLEFRVTGDVRNPQAHLRPAVERLIAKAMRDKILAGPEAILRAGKTGTQVGAKALQVGKKTGGVMLEGAKRVGGWLKGLFGR